MEQNLENECGMIAPKDVKKQTVGTNHFKSRVLPLDLPRDNIGRYIPYCSFCHHRGLVFKNHYECEKRNCDYYVRAYIR